MTALSKKLLLEPREEKERRHLPDAKSEKQDCVIGYEGRSYTTGSGSHISVT